MKSFMLCVIFLTFACFVIGQQDASDSGNREKCDLFLASAGASSNFAGAVAHAIHSLSVEELQRFYPTANEINFVPTINKNLTASNVILLYAPAERNEPVLFLTDAMNAIDSILKRMDENLWDIKNYSPLERVVHLFHMKEVWARALKEYRIIESNPPKYIENVCQCAMDIGNNGIMQIMKYIALVIREPSLVYGNPTFKNFTWDANIYKFNFMKVLPLKDTGGRDLNAWPRLNNAAAWNVWKQMVSRQESYDAALFLYCAAKKAENI